MLRRNYDKAEFLLRRVLIEFRTHHIFKSLEDLEKSQQKTANKIGTVSNWLGKMKTDLGAVHRKCKKTAKGMGVTMTQLDYFEKNSHAISSSDWKSLKKISQDLSHARDNLYDADTMALDQQIIEEEINDYRDKKHVTARKGWRPA